MTPYTKILEVMLKDAPEAVRAEALAKAVEVDRKVRRDYTTWAMGLMVESMPWRHYE